MTRIARAIRSVRLDTDGDGLVEGFVLAAEWFRDVLAAEAINESDPCGCGHDRWMHEHDRPA